VKRPRRDATDAQTRQPGTHLGRGASGERDREHVPGLDLLGQGTIGDPVRDGAGLAGAGPGENAERPTGRGDRDPLLVVQPAQHTSR
jgi:hypothetical protein